MLSFCINFELDMFTFGAKQPEMVKLKPIPEFECYLCNFYWIFILHAAYKSAKLQIRRKKKLYTNDKPMVDILT